MKPFSNKLWQGLLVYLFHFCQSDGSSVGKTPHCGGGDPCIYMSKDEGWILYEESKGPKPYPPTSDSWKRNDSTIALNPSRIFVAVVQQNEKEDEDCYDEYCRLMVGNTSQPCPYSSNIRMNRVDAKLAEGPTWARALGSKMVQNEEFCMQTDSHMDFVPHWDKYMLLMWGMTENEYAVLSTYVAPTDQLGLNMDGQNGLNGLHEVPHLCMVTFQGAYDMIRNWGTKCMRMIPKPKLTNIVWGAGLSFSKCHAERKVPYDPYTPGIFDGEEFSRGLRLWTYGYDIYSPHRVYVVHNYQVSQSDPKHSGWAYNSHGHDIETSVRRLRTVFGMPNAESDPTKAMAIVRGRYGRGDRRSLEQAIAFSGIDTFNRKTLFNGCGNLDFVPFKEHPKGADYIPEFDPVTELPLDEPDEGSIYFDQRKGLAIVPKYVNGFVAKSDKRGDSSGHSSNLAVTTGSPATGTQLFRSKIKKKLLDEYALLLEVETEAKYELDKTGYPVTILLLIFSVLIIGVVIVGSHRFHIGKRHQLGNLFDSVKTV